LQLAHQVQRNFGMFLAQRCPLGLGFLHAVFPNTVWPAAISGRIASAGWVLDTATSVTVSVLRRAMRAAWSMRARMSFRWGCSGPVMARCYSVVMAKRYPVPRLVLLSDARNDAVLDRALARLPRGSALVFRHYHLSAPERRRRWAALRRQAASRGVALIAAGASCGRGAQGHYGAPSALAGGGLRLATAHSLREIGAAARAGADAVLLSPVLPTRSHPGAPVLGMVRFLLLARQSPCPVLALGGMTRRAARRLPRGGRVQGWAAIDGLS
jgi:thiamine-phosphate pyrophosphorylase